MIDYKQIIEQWQNRHITTTAELEQQLGGFPILFAYHSGKIENDAIRLKHIRSIFAEGRVSDYTGTPETLFEHYNPRLCHRFLLPRIITQEPLTAEHVKEIHTILTAGTYDEHYYIENGERPGSYKRRNYVVGADVGVRPEAVEDEVVTLLAEVSELFEQSNASAPTLLKIAAYLHCRFEFLHPFADGNGRTGRTLVNYFLMVHGHPPLIVHEEDRCTYYDCLRAYDEMEHIDPMVKFFIYCTEKTWNDNLSAG